MPETQTLQPWLDTQLWSQVDKISLSKEGSSGVFFLHSNQTKQVVLKTTAEPALDIFANKLFEHLGIQVPRIRLVKNEDYKEWSDLKACCLSLSERTSFPIKIERELQRRYFLVMEYVHSVELPSYIDTRLKINESLSSHQIQQLGSIIAGDILLNNWDRLPFVWNNNGNPYNLIVSLNTDLKDIIAIDQRPTALFGPGEEKYLQVLESFLKNLAENLDIETPQTERARELLTTPGRRYLFSKELIPTLQTAIVSELKKISMIEIETIEKIKAEVSSLVTVDERNFWKNSLAKIRIPFFQSVILLITRYFPNS
jgi:hypothetical protein